MDRVEQSGLAYYRNEAWPTLSHGIFTRHGGVSRAQWWSLNVGGNNGDDSEAVKENHKRMFRAANVNESRVATTWLVHSTETIVVEEPSDSQTRLAKADGMITDRTDTPLVMRFADCVPLLLYDRCQRVIGLGHAGWRGTVNGMAGKMVDAMREAYGSRPENIEVVIGPAISQPNYQVGEEVVSEVQAYFGEASGLIRRDPVDKSAYLDLWLANEIDFRQRGVDKVKVLRLCTFENLRDFFSHRAERGKTGRFGVVMSL